MKTPRYDLYRDNWQDFVHFRWLRLLLKKVPFYNVDDLNNDTSQAITRTAVDDTNKVGTKVYQTSLTYSTGDYPRHPGEDQTTILKPYISDQLDFYWNKYTKPRLEALEGRCHQLENRCDQLENRVHELENNN